MVFKILIIIYMLPPHSSSRKNGMVYMPKGVMVEKKRKKAINEFKKINKIKNNEDKNSK